MLKIKEEFMKKIAVLLLSLFVALNFIACTSGESRDTEESAIAQGDEGMAADSELENTDGAAVDNSEIAPDESQAGFSDEQLPDQAVNEQDQNNLSADQLAPNDMEQVAPVDEGQSAIANNDEVAAPPAEETPAPAPDTSAGVDLGSSETPAPMEEAPIAAPVEEEKPAKVVSSLKKVDETPRSVGGTPLNAVYVARPGDTFKSISEMIYHDGSRQKDLKKWNSWISNLSPGDKVYYNSPNRPQDMASVKNYYEEQGAQSETYVAKEGDNLRKVSKNLLGYSNAWKEVWATNATLESKGDLAPGTELKYWKKSDMSSGMQSGSELAGINQAPPPPAEMPPAPDMAQNELPPVDELPPPPDMNAGASGSMAEMPPPPPPTEMAPPPPPPAEMAPPPPPPIAEKPPRPQPVVGGDDTGFTNDDMMMGLAGIGIIAAGVAAMMVIRKRRQQKEMQAAFGDTQVGA